MGRRNKKNRKKNRSNNRNTGNNFTPTFTPISMKFLKRCGDVGLFVDGDGDKFRVHKEHIYGTFGWLVKGRYVSVRKEYLNEVKNKRLVVSNPIPESKQPEDSEPYTFGHDIKVVASAYDAARLDFPMGTQYHHISYNEAPKKGDFVAGMRTGGHKNLMGEVSYLTKDKDYCVVNGVLVSIYEIGYKIVNVDFFKKYKLANA